MCSVNPASSFGRIQCCNLKMLGFDLCNVGQKIRKNSKPETDYCFYVKGLEKKNPYLKHLNNYNPFVCNPLK